MKEVARVYIPDSVVNPGILNPLYRTSLPHPHCWSQSNVEAARDRAREGEGWGVQFCRGASRADCLPAGTTRYLRGSYAPCLSVKSTRLWPSRLWGGTGVWEAPRGPGASRALGATGAGPLCPDSGRHFVVLVRRRARERERTSVADDGFRFRLF